MREYPSSLTETEWEIRGPLLPAEPLTLRGRPQLHTRRDIMNGILYILRTGGAWRMMPHDLPHWKTCCHYFRRWAKQGWWKKSMIPCGIKHVSKAVKKAPTAAIIDSQSIRTASQPGVRGFDAGKKITGRKRHVLADTRGNLPGLHVTAADVQDRDGAQSLLSRLLETSCGWLKLIWADGGHSGKLAEEIAQISRHRKVKLEIVKRSDEMKGFKVLPKRWIVERTFGWLIQSRRLIRDYEVKIEHSEAMICLSMAKRMLTKIAI